MVRAAFLQQADWTAEEHTLISAMLHDDADWTCQLGLMSAIAAYAQGDAAAARGHLERSLEVATERAPHHLPELIATRAAIDAADGRHDDALAAAREAQARTGTTTASAVQLVAVLPKVALALLDAGLPQEAVNDVDERRDDAAERFGIHQSTIADSGGCVGDRAAAPPWLRRSPRRPRRLRVAGGVGLRPPPEPVWRWPGWAGRVRQSYRRGPVVAGRDGQRAAAVAGSARRGG